MSGRVNNVTAYVLHSRPYSESSLIIDVFSQTHGHVPLLARGARRPRSSLRGLLLAFQPLQVSWSGKGAIYTLHKADWLGGLPLLQGEALICGYYLNELLLRLLPREDAHPRLFERYSEILVRLANAASRQTLEGGLRRFEKNLLEELGYGLSLQHDHAGAAVEAEECYAYRIEQGPLKLAKHEASGLCVSGRTLLNLASEDFSAARTRQESKQLMRTLLAYYLDGKPLQTRKMFGADIS